MGCLDGVPSIDSVEHSMIGGRQRYDGERRALNTNQKSQQQWLIVEFEIDPKQEELAGWLMIHLGATGCELNPEALEKPTLQATFPQGKLPGDDLTPINAA